MKLKFFENEKIVNPAQTIKIDKKQIAIFFSTS